MATMESTQPADTDQNSPGCPRRKISSPVEMSGWAMIPTLNPWSINQ